MTGRKSEYNQEIANKILDQIIEGKSLRTICKVRGMPHWSTIFKWIHDVEGFAEHYAHARAESSNALFEELLDICDNGTNDWMEKNAKGNDRTIWKAHGEHIQRSKLRVDTRKWALSKLQPKKFGEHFSTEHSGTIGLTDMSESQLDQRIKDLENQIQQSQEG